MVGLLLRKSADNCYGDATQTKISKNVCLLKVKLEGSTVNQDFIIASYANKHQLEEKLQGIKFKLTKSKSL